MVSCVVYITDTDAAACSAANGLQICVKMGAWATVLLGWDVHVWTQPSIGIIACTATVCCPGILSRVCKTAYIAAATQRIQAFSSPP